MSLGQKEKKNENRWYRGRNRPKTVKNATLLFWGAFFGGGENFFCQKLQFSNFICARSYVYGAKRVQKRQKHKNANFGGKFRGQEPQKKFSEGQK